MNLPLNNGVEPFTFDGDFQFRALAVLMQDPQMMGRWKHAIRPDYFADATARMFCGWTYEYFDVYGQLPTEVALNQMVNEMALANPDLGSTVHVYRQWVNSLLTSHITEREYIFDQIEVFCRDQEIKLAWLEAGQKIQRGEDLADVPNLFEEAVSRLAQTHGSLGLDPVNMPDEEIHARLFARDVRDPIATCWPRLNEVIGGAGKKEMLVFAAPPNTGKSWTLANIGVAAAQAGKFVVHYSLEMSEELNTHRYYAILTGLPLNELAHNPAAIATANQNLRDVGGRFIVKEFPPNTMRVLDLRDHLIFIEAQCGRRPDMVVVDYADLCAPRGKNFRSESETVMRHALAGIYIDLRGIAVQRELAMVTVSQTNRSSVNKETITIADLAECFEKAAHADIIVALCQNEDEIQQQRLRFHVAKNRTQRKGDEIPVSIDFATGAMIEQLAGGGMNFNVGNDSGGSPVAGPPMPAWISMPPPPQVDAGN